MSHKLNTDKIIIIFVRDIYKYVICYIDYINKISV